MSRLFLAMQLPIKMRYSEWFYDELPKHFRQYFSKVICLGSMDLLGDNLVDESKNFSNTDVAVAFELAQIKNFMSYDFKDDDYLLHMDLSFPGFFHNILYHKKIKNAFAFCHATSKNSYDYFVKVRSSKWHVESGHSKVYKKVFVASEYHKEKLGWKNCVVTGLPTPPFPGWPTLNKNIGIISVARPTVQKVSKRVEKDIEDKFGKIYRSTYNSWEEYYKTLSKAKVMILTGREETFGYSIIDAIKNNVIPIAPKSLVYPEMLDNDYLFVTMEDLFRKIAYALTDRIEIPKLKNQTLIDNFYNKITSEMLEE